MNKYVKRLLVVVGIIIVIVVVVITFISPLTKYFIEKYDEEYTGRQIAMDEAYVNPFTGYINFSNLKVYEFKSDSIFFSADNFIVNVSVLKMFFKTYEITEFTLNSPRGIIIQEKEDFNFNDLIEKFSTKDNSDTNKAPIHFNILKIKIKNGEFYYREKTIPINYFIKKVNFESSGKRWDTDTIAAKFSFLSGIGSGDMKGDFMINLKNLDYRLAIVVERFDLNIVAQYLKDLTNYGSFSASLDADMKSKGNIMDEEDVTASGVFSISDFHFGKNPKEDYASFDRLAVSITELSPKNHKYLYDSISLSNPYFKYERYDYLDNVETIFGKNGAKISAAKANPDQFNLVIEIADYIKVISRNFFKSNYKINRLAIYNGDIKFNDYSISEKFSIELSPFYFIADSIDKNYKRVNAILKSGIKPYGNFSVAISVNPKDSSDFDLQYYFLKIPVSLFNPYTVTYTSFPLDRGTVELKGKWTVRNGNIKSTNNLLVIDPRLSNRLRNKSTNWIPMRMIMPFVRERGNVIDYEIPITGNLNDPKFNLQDVLFDVLENLFIKPITIPYSMEVKNVEREIEKSLTLKWHFRQNLLGANQEKFIKRMAKFLLKNPEAFITVYPRHYEIKEKEYILFFEAKKKYFLSTGNSKSFSEDDSVKVEKMSVKDSLFVRYLNKQTYDSMLFTVQDKCARLIGSTIVNGKFEQLCKERESEFLFFFKEGDVRKRIKLSKGESTIPYNGFSFYKIQYKGEFPESLIKAYSKMEKLNDKEPRRKFKKERKKI